MQKSRTWNRVSPCDGIGKGSTYLEGKFTEKDLGIPVNKLNISQ